MNKGGGMNYMYLTRTLLMFFSLLSLCAEKKKLFGVTFWATNWTFFI